MWQTVFSVLELIILAILLYVSNHISGPFGGFLHLAISQTLRIPVLGRLFRILLQKPMYLNAVTKPIAWTLSSTGVLLGLAVHQLIWQNLNRPAEFWVLLSIALISTLKQANNMFTFDTEFTYLHEYSKVFLGEDDLSNLVPRTVQDLILLANRAELVRLARSQFLDRVIVDLLKFLVNLGVVFYSLGKLGFLPTSLTSSVPGLWESILSSLSLLDITGELPTVFVGDLWSIIRLFSSFIIFLWLIIFITLTSSSVEEGIDEMLKQFRHKRPRPWQEELNEMIESFQQSNLKKTWAESNSSPKGHYVKIWEAMIAPDGKDAGNETITLLNLTTKRINIEGWTIRDTHNRELIIQAGADINPGDKLVINLLPNTVKLADSRGKIDLIDNEGTVIDSTEYHRTDIGKDGRVIWAMS